VSRTTTNLVYGVTGQTFSYRVPQGRPTSATFSVFSFDAGDDDTPEFTGTATVDSVSTSVTSASGASQSDPQRINLSTTSIVAGTKYLLSEASVQEWVTPVEIQTGYVRCRYPLKNDYTTAGTFVGTTISGTVDSAWIANLSNISDPSDPDPGYRVRWSIVVSGVTYVAYSHLDVVRAPVGHQVDVDDISARAPGWSDSIPTDYIEEQGRPVIDAAWLSVQAKLASLGIDTDAMRNDQILDELVILRALNIIAIGGWRPGGYASQAEYVAVTQGEYDRFLEQHFEAAPRHRLGIETNGAAERTKSVSVWGK
jgi:hypothetical protein